MSAPLLPTFKRWIKYELRGTSATVENNCEAYVSSPTSCFLRQAGLIDGFGEDIDDEEVDLYQAAILIMALLDQFTSRLLFNQQEKVLSSNSLVLKLLHSSTFSRNQQINQICCG